MRYNITKKSSTIAERRVYEVLKKLNIPFKHRWLIKGNEVDFLIGDRICLEVDGHFQNPNKNKKLFDLGYIPIHIGNDLSKDQELLVKLIKQLYGGSSDGSTNRN